MTDILTVAFAAFIVTILITESHIFEQPRNWFNKLMPKAITEDYIFIECFICVAFYATLAIGLFAGLLPIQILAAYGINYAVYNYTYE